MSGLVELELKPEYRSDESNVVDSFYIPCLSASVQYDRAVGYFTAGGLSLAARGLTVFVKGEGHMRLVASPLLNEEDAKEMARGYRLREEIIVRALNREFDQIRELDPSTPEAVRAASLAWLIAEGRLDVRLALRKASNPEAIRGIYHEKLGLFSDAEGNVVAFSGSANETVGGLLNNFEAIDVFLSWDDPQNRVSRKVGHFERLWENRTPGVEIMEFPDAARERLLTLRPSSAPQEDPESDARSIHEGRAAYVTGQPEDQIPEFAMPAGLSLWQHQEQAIEAWLGSEDASSDARLAGFLEMATGAGKTIAALTAAKRLHESLGRLAIVVVAPTKVLVDQWVEAGRRFGLLPIAAHSDSPHWREDAFGAARAFKRSHTDQLFLVATSATFATDGFAGVIEEIGHPFMFVADEVHNLGAPIARQYLPEQAEYRLALSATPERPYDDDGNAALDAYFGPTVFQFGLREAIGVCLTPYDYRVVPVELTIDEMDEFAALSAKIARFGGASPTRDDSPQLQSLLIQRSRLISSAVGKPAALSTEIDALDAKSIRHTFVYTSDKDPQQTIDVVRLLQDDKRLLVHQFTEAETANQAVRRELLSRFSEAATLQVLVAKRCLDEGVDIPPARRAYFLASTTNPRQYIQRRGRLLRMHPGKTHATIVDFIAVPPEKLEDRLESSGRNLVRLELRRVREFADCARNGAETRAALLSIGQKFDALDVVAGGA